MKNIMLPQGYKILDVVQETKAEYTFRVACDCATAHGQFFQISIPKVGEAPISVSGKGEGYVEFTIRKVGRLTEGVFGLAKGDTLFMRGPYGNAFPAESFKGKPLLIISGGTGIAPVRTMLYHFCKNPQELISLNLISGFKNRDGVLFAQELDYFRSHCNAIFTLDDGAQAGFEGGMVTAHIDKIPLKDFEDFQVVIVGPPAMMHFAALKCIECGAKEENMWLSFERKMSCAVGKCGHCKIDETYVCLEGPVFNYTKAKSLLD